jgi:monoamine oxidase
VLRDENLLSRRELLGAAAISTAALAWGCAGNASVTPLSGDYDVIVIGAGPGGLGAAQALRGKMRVLVLEARNRVGGRAWTNNSFPQPFDYGAQYFDMCKARPEGGTYNPLYDLAIERGVRVSPEGQDSFLMHEGIPLPEATMAVGELLFQIDTLIKAAGQMAAGGAPDVSAAVACASIQDDPNYKLATSIMVNQRDFMEHLSSLDYYHQALLMDAPIGGASTETFLVPDGLGNFIASLADGLEIVYNTPATMVDSREAGKIRVETESGTVTARHVIVAVPQSILVKEKLRFKPGLPPAKIEGLHRLPMFTVDKIAIEFTQPVFADFNDNTLVGQYVENSDRSASIVTKFMGKNQATVIVGGDTALEFEAGGQDAIRAFARETIANVFGAEAASAISRMACNPWGTDPWAGGSWTMADVGFASERLLTGEPIDDRIFFAGEPYAEQIYGTTQAAYATGRKAAERILELAGLG